MVDKREDSIFWLEDDFETTPEVPDRKAKLKIVATVLLVWGMLFGALATVYFVGKHVGRAEVTAGIVECSRLDKGLVVSWHCWPTQKRAPHSMPRGSDG